MTQNERRLPLPVSSDFLQIQDEYLQEVNRERGITNIADLKCIKEIVGSSPTMTRGLYLWQGDITTLKVDAIVNAANSQLLGCFAPLHACIDNCIHTFASIQLRLACNELMKKRRKIRLSRLPSAVFRQEFSDFRQSLLPKLQWKP